MGTPGERCGPLTRIGERDVQGAKGKRGVEEIGQAREGVTVKLTRVRKMWTAAWEKGNFPQGKVFQAGM